MSEPNTKYPTQVRFPRELKAVVKADAQRRGTTLSEVVRTAVVDDQTRRGNWPPKEER